MLWPWNQRGLFNAVQAKWFIIYNGNLIQVKDDCIEFIFQKIYLYCFNMLKQLHSSSKLIHNENSSQVLPNFPGRHFIRSCLLENRSSFLQQGENDGNGKENKLKFYVYTKKF